MLKKIIFIAIIYIWIGESFAQVSSFGTCPSLTGKASFNLDSYAGRWYSYEQYPMALSLFAKCITFLKTNSNGNINVDNTQINGFGRNVTIKGVATPVSGSSGKYTYKINSFPLVMNYYILDTDYTGYAVAYSCYQTLFLKWETVWILSRTPTLTSALSTTARNVVTANSLSLSPLKTVDQSCFK